MKPDNEMGEEKRPREIEVLGRKYRACVLVIDSCEGVYGVPRKLTLLREDEKLELNGDEFMICYVPVEMVI
jgi:hypothetical protein